MAFQDDYPELAAMFEALQDGLKAVETGEGYDDIWDAGAHLRSASMGLGGYEQIIAAGLRMVADAIDPPEDRDPPITPEEEAWIAENMGGFDEKLVVALVETKAKIEAQAELKRDIAEMLERPKRPSPCLCGNQPTHERDVCPFEDPEAEPPEFPIYVDAQGNEHGEF